MEKGVYRLPHIDGLIALFGQQRVCSLECAVRFAILVIFEQRAREFELTGKKIGLELQQRAILGFRSEQITAFASEAALGILDQHRVAVGIRSEEHTSELQ